LATAIPHCAHALFACTLIQDKPFLHSRHENALQKEYKAFSAITNHITNNCATSNRVNRREEQEVIGTIGLEYSEDMRKGLRMTSIS
jgi:hypothetical protein